MTVQEFMSFAIVTRASTSGQIGDAEWYWSLWAREMRLLRVLSTDPNLAEELERTICHSRKALRSDAAYHRKMAVLAGQISPRDQAKQREHALLVQLREEEDRDAADIDGVW